MQTTNKDVMQESAQIVAQKTDIPDGPNVGPSPQEHLAAKGIVKPPLHAQDVAPAESADGTDEAADADADTQAVPDQAQRRAAG